ncbi:FecCD family ABC transporter permease [Paenibacillus cymbidii]|uniref:FecCD family ABC transporter permease n=1 Tax=Paenibacillus cymbidii TaxID=1639034 RepID=UPI001081CBC0|nr:iron ABC transporter permease [Paenibacillus cymbidii]
MKAYIPLRSRSRRWSLLVHKRTVAVSAALLLVCALVGIVSTGLGDMYISPLEVVRSLFGAGAEEHQMVVRELRLPRLLVALMAGASLAASGAILQGMIRNPLASPDMIGVTGGASTAAVAFLAFWSGQASIRLLPLVAMTGALQFSAVLYVLAWRKGVTPLRLVLVGVGMASLTSAATTMMIVFHPKNDAGQAYQWLTGSVYAANWENVLSILPWTAVLLPLAYGLARHVNIGQLGDDVAASAGSAVEAKRLLLLFVSVALAGAAVAVGGGIGFVGLIAPHMARKLVGASFDAVLPVAALLGAVIVMAADLAGRTLFLPLDIPVGVFTSAVGAPYFIYLLYTHRNSR